MKIALLVCDHVAEEYVEEHGTYVQMFEQLLPDLTLDPYFVCDYFFPDVKNYDVFICTGSKKSVYDDESWIKHLLELIQEIDNEKKLFIGVCFGHQAVAQALGGKVSKADHGYLIGIHQFDVITPQSWMGSNAVDHYNTLMLCQDQVTKLPNESTVIASSDLCPVGMYQVGSHILCIQGHPEFSKEYNKGIFVDRLRKVDAQKVDLAIESLELELNNEQIAKWITAFLQQGLTNLY